MSLPKLQKENAARFWDVFLFDGTSKNLASSLPRRFLTGLLPPSSEGGLII